MGIRKRVEPGEGAVVRRGPEGFSSKRATDEDDVEGHSLVKKGPEGAVVRRGPEGAVVRRGPEGFSSKRATDEDDVEGHSLVKK